MSYPLVLDLAADGIPVTVTCRVLGFSTQAFNKWRRNPVSGRDWDEAQLINAAIDIHDDDPAFGYRFISDELADSVELADAGISASERRVWLLCSQQGIWSVFAKKKGLSRKAGPPVHDDLVGRDFTAERPNGLWLTDITEHRTLGFQRSSQRFDYAVLSKALNRSAGVSQSRALRGRPLSSSVIAVRSSALRALRSVPFGRYWRSSPLVFSFVPRCQGAARSQK